MSNSRPPAARLLHLPIGHWTRTRNSPLLTHLSILPRTQAARPSKNSKPAQNILLTLKRTSLMELRSKKAFTMSVSPRLRVHSITILSGKRCVQKRARRVRPLRDIGGGLAGRVSISRFQRLCALILGLIVRIRASVVLVRPPPLAPDLFRHLVEHGGSESARDLPEDGICEATFLRIARGEHLLSLCSSYLRASDNIINLETMSTKTAEETSKT